MTWKVLRSPRLLYLSAYNNHNTFLFRLSQFLKEFTADEDIDYSKDVALPTKLSQQTSLRISARGDFEQLSQSTVLANW